MITPHASSANGLRVVRILLIVSLQSFRIRGPENYLSTNLSFRTFCHCVTVCNTFLFHFLPLWFSNRVLRNFMSAANSALVFLSYSCLTSSWATSQCHCYIKCLILYLFLFISQRTFYLLVYLLSFVLLSQHIQLLEIRSQPNCRHTFKNTFASLRKFKEVHKYLFCYL
jgi:hypothetical protein